MKDNLEKFIIENREEFDIHEPPTGAWNKIEKNIRPPKTINWRSVIYRAAAVVLIFAASYLVHEYIGNLKEGQVAKEEPREKKSFEIPELKEAEVYYSSLINEKFKEIKPILIDNPSLEKEIRYDLDQLDSLYTGLKKDLKDNIANGEIIEAMIQNYRLRLSILEDVLSMLKPNDNEKETYHNL
jgi:hypothetical protein